MSGTFHRLVATAPHRVRLHRAASTQGLPIAKVEEVMGGAVTLEHFGKADFVRNALPVSTFASFG